MCSSRNWYKEVKIKLPNIQICFHILLIMTLVFNCLLFFITFFVNGANNRFFPYCLIYTLSDTIFKLFSFVNNFRNFINRFLYVLYNWFMNLILVLAKSFIYGESIIKCFELFRNKIWKMFINVWSWYELMKTMLGCKGLQMYTLHFSFGHFPTRKKIFKSPKVIVKRKFDNAAVFSICHRQKKVVLKNTIVHFVNCRFCYEALNNKFNLNSTKLGE